MTQQLLVPLVSAFTGITAVFVLFGLLSLVAGALNRIFPHTQAEDDAQKENAMSLHVSPQVDEETVAVIQAAIAAHLKRAP